MPINPEYYFVILRGEGRGTFELLSTEVHRFFPEKKYFRVYQVFSCLTIFQFSTLRCFFYFPPQYRGVLLLHTKFPLIIFVDAVVLCKLLRSRDSLSKLVRAEPKRNSCLQLDCKMQQRIFASTYNNNIFSQPNMLTSFVRCISGL